MHNEQLEIQRSAWTHHAPAYLMEKYRDIFLNIWTWCGMEDSIIQGHCVVHSSSSNHQLCNEKRICEYFF